MGSPTFTQEDIRRNAVKMGAAQWFLDAIPILWNVAIRYGVRPEVVAGQCYHETGGGFFRNRVPVTYNNTCGLKVRNPIGDRPEDHAQFPSVAKGFEAQCQHLCKYAGHPLPVGVVLIDPRYHLPVAGSAKTVNALTDKWAPTELGKAPYGTLVERSVDRLTAP